MVMGNGVVVVVVVVEVVIVVVVVAAFSAVLVMADEWRDLEPCYRSVLMLFNRSAHNCVS